MYARQAIIGGLFGFFAIGCMYAKIPVYEGVIVDQRNAVIVLSGLCGGPISAFVGAALAGTFRVYLGGGGVLAGVVGVCLAAIAGTCLNKFFKKFDSIPKAIFGSLMATVIILPGFLLVEDLQTGWVLMKSMFLPYGTAIFIGIAVGGLLLNKQDYLHKMEKDFRESEEKFRALADTSPLAIYMSEGIEQKAVYINPTFTALFGYTIDEVPTVDHWWPLAYPDEKYRKQISKEWLEKVQHAIENRKEIEPMEVVVTSKNGEKKYISWGFFTIGKQNWSCGFDLTERKQAEDQKMALEIQLRQSHKMEAIGTLAGGIAHDFNNLLAVILGYAELAMDDTPHYSPARQQIEQVLKAGNRAKELVKHILSFSRKEPHKRVPVQIHLIVKDALNLIRASIPSTITIKQIIDFQCGNILADPTQIHQVLMNLCTNAAQSMDENGGVLEVGLFPD